MNWRRREDRRTGDMAHGITFVMHERFTPRTSGVAEIGTTKQLLRTGASLTLALGQKRYGDELVAQVYTRDAPIHMKRKANGWNRVQVFLGPADASTATMLESLAREIRERCGTRGGA